MIIRKAVAITFSAALLATGVGCAGYQSERDLSTAERYDTRSSVVVDDDFQRRRLENPPIQRRVIIDEHPVEERIIIDNRPHTERVIIDETPEERVIIDNRPRDGNVTYEREVHVIEQRRD